MSRARRITIVCLFLLACIGIVGSSVAVWAHQVALNTDRWVSIVGPLAQDPEVVASVSDRLATQVVTALDVEARASEVLPPRASFLAATLASGMHDVLAKQIARALESDTFQSIWITANRVVHQNVVRILRGDLGNVTITKGVVELNLLGLIDTVLHQLQTAGLIPASVTLPDVANVEVPAQAIARLEGALGVDLPDDFGQIPLFKSDALATAQAAVRAFDILVVALLVITALLIVSVVALARRRLRAIVALAVGGIVALLAARLAIRGIEGAVVDALADSSRTATVRAVLHAAIGDVTNVLGIVAILAVVVGVAAYVASRPAWLTRGAQSVRGATGEAASTATEAASSGRAGAGEWIRAHRGPLRWLGVGAVLFVVAYVALGLELALLSIGLLAIYEVGLQVIGPGPAGGSVSGE